MMCESGMWNGGFHGNETSRQAGESHILSTKVIEALRPPEGDTESSEFSGDCEDLGPHCLLPHPPLLFEIGCHPSFRGKGREKLKKWSLKGVAYVKKCRKDYKRKVLSLHREKQLY